jgi:PAS domain S-box-containing protein
MTLTHPSINTSARTRALPFAQLLCPCWVHDSNTGAILDVNPAALELYGYDRAQFLTLTVNGLRHEQEHRHLDIHLDASAAAAAEGRQAARAPVYWLHRSKLGASLAVSLTALEVDWNGRPARLVFAVDVTALRAARLESKLLQRYMECEGDMIVVMQAEGDVDGGHPMLYVNKAFERHTGYTSAEVLGRQDDLFHGPLTDAREVQRMRTAMARSDAVVVELWHYDKLRTPYRVEMTMTPVDDERGWLQYWVSSRRDITERAQAELALIDLSQSLNAEISERTGQLQQALSTLESASRSVAQDVANHLHEMRSFADMIQLQHGTSLPADAARLLDLLQKSAQQMQRALRKLPAQRDDSYQNSFADTTH